MTHVTRGRAFGPRIKCGATVLLVLLFPFPASASLESDLSKVFRSIKGDGFLTLSVENDLLGSGTDRYYSSGVRLTWFNPAAPMPDFAKVIDRAVPTFRLNGTTSVYYSVGHNIYTPADITRAAQDPFDRPWAGFLYASAGLSTVTDNHADNVEATLGVVGPAALGRQVQSFIHKHVSDSPRPMGWDNQLKNEPALMLSWERRWPERYGFDALGWSAAVVPYIGSTLGNVYTYANTGLSLRLSPTAGRWQDDPVRVRPAMPGTGAFVVPEGTFSWYVYAGAEGRAVARNIFLDGNSFTDSHRVDKRHFVADFNAGVAATYGRYRVTYGGVYRTREFKGQGDNDLFGAVNFGVRF